MAQMSVAPPSMPVIAASQAAAPQGMGAEAAPGEEAGVDFAAVLKKHIAQPAKDALETENIAALVPAQTSGPDDEPTAEDGLPVAPDLTGLMPALARPMPIATTDTPLVQPAVAPSEARRPLISVIPNPATSNTLAQNATAQTAPPMATTQGAANGIPVPFAQFGTEVAAGEEKMPPPQQLPRPAMDLAGQAARDASTAAKPAGGAESQLPTATADRAKPLVAEAQMPQVAADQTKPMAAEPLAATAAAASAGSDAPISSTSPLVHNAPAASSPSGTRIETPVGNRGWDTEFAQKVVLLVNRHEGRAELTLTPPQLGKVEITISVNGDQTSATFVSASPAAREALEQALPRLREMMAEAGISLGQASVSTESAQRGQDEAPTPGRGGRSAEAPRAAEAATQWVQRSSGLIDTFA